MSALSTSAQHCTDLTQCSWAHQGSGLHAAERSLMARALASKILVGKDHQLAASHTFAVPVFPVSDRPGENLPTVTRRFSKTRASAASVDTRPAAQPPRVPVLDTIRTDQTRHLLRIRTLPDQPAPANRAEREIWEEVTPGAWQGHLLYPRSFFDMFVKYINRASDGVWGKGQGPLSSMVS
jgi:hypothetical protein